MICKNNEFYFTHIFPKIYINLIGFNPTFYIYENNSTDKTIHLLSELQNNYSNIKVFNESTKTYLNRYLNICCARNRLMYFYNKHNKTSDEEYVLMLDTNILFKKSTISNLINQTKLNTNLSMITPFTTYYNSKNNTYQYYFDILAYNYGKYFLTKTSPNLTFDMMLNENESNKFKDLVSVDTCFGGLGLIKKEILSNIVWEFKKPPEVLNKNLNRNIICEHWLFCQKIKKYGNILIHRNSEAVWLVENDIRLQQENIINFIKSYFL